MGRYRFPETVKHDTKETHEKSNNRNTGLHGPGVAAVVNSTGREPSLESAFFFFFL